jgi:DNA-binding CsgD family transcriptional regulator
VSGLVCQRCLQGHEKPCLLGDVCQCTRCHTTYPPKPKPTLLPRRTHAEQRAPIEGRVQHLERQVALLWGTLQGRARLDDVEPLAPPPRRRPSTLPTSVQQEVAARLVAGQTLSAIARELDITRDKVRTIRNEMLKRAGVE